MGTIPFQNLEDNRPQTRNHIPVLARPAYPRSYGSRKNENMITIRGGSDTVPLSRTVCRGTFSDPLRNRAQEHDFTTSFPVHSPTLFDWPIELSSSRPKSHALAPPLLPKLAVPWIIICEVAPPLPLCPFWWPCRRFKDGKNALPSRYSV